MQIWLQITIGVILLTGIIVGLVFAGLAITKKLEKPGLCTFITFSQGANPQGLSQAGYIACNGGGNLWRPTSIKITNNGPGDFYLGPLTGFTEPQKLTVGSSIVADLSNILPNVYYDSTSQYTSPNFSIAVSK